MRTLAIFILASGCGFKSVASTDGGEDLAAMMAPIDFAGVDLYGVDLSGVGNPPDLSTGGGIGAGPLGALAPGVCCTRDEDCAGRRCVTGWCSGFCTDDSFCQRFAGTGMHCDGATSECVPVAMPYTCKPASSYQYGAIPTGSCCSGSLSSNDACEGGLCIGTGNCTNPFYCSQGCKSDADCPPNYTCFASANGFASDIRDCWKNPTATDPTATYTCQ
jgi:hypothetical protein